MPGRKRPRVIVKQSSICEGRLVTNKGLFANRDFAPNEAVITWNEYPEKNHGVDFLNHSCAPSCILIEVCPTDFSKDYLVAGPAGLRSGDEITFDYRKTKWKDLWRRTIQGKCGCPIRGSVDVRSIIGDLERQNSNAPLLFGITGAIIAISSQIFPKGGTAWHKRIRKLFAMATL